MGFRATVSPVMVDSILAYLGSALSFVERSVAAIKLCAESQIIEFSIPDERPSSVMETPLSPLEFARRARQLYPARDAVVDGDLRLNYEEFFGRCDRWSAALQALGVQEGDRVAYIAPNTHAQLESFYAVPQIGAVLVPLNYRLIADDFAYLINHSGARIVCVHSDYLEAVESIRAQLPNVSAFVALEGSKPGWLDYETLLAEAPRHFHRPTILETDLLTINYTSGTTSRPKGVMITHRNAYINIVGTLLHHPMTLTDRYLWTLPMFHANGWTFVWIVTAVGAAHICLRKVEPIGGFPEDRSGIGEYALRRADGVDQHRPCAGRTQTRSAPWRPRSDRRRASRCGHDRANRGRTRMGDHASLRADRDIALYHDLRIAT